MAALLRVLGEYPCIPMLRENVVSLRLQTYSTIDVTHITLHGYAHEASRQCLKRDLGVAEVSQVEHDVFP